MPPPLTSLQLAIDAATGAFNVSLDGSLWLRGLTPTAAWNNATTDALALNHMATSQGSHPTLGAFNETRFAWSAADGTRVETAFQIFDDGETVLLEQAFPAGLPSSLAHDTVVLRFPSFQISGCVIRGA